MDRVSAVKTGGTNSIPRWSWVKPELVIHIVLLDIWQQKGHCFNRLHAF